MTCTVKVSQVQAIKPSPSNNKTSMESNAYAGCLLDYNYNHESTGRNISVVEYQIKRNILDF